MEKKAKNASVGSEKDLLMDQKLLNDFQSAEGKAKRKKQMRRFFLIMLAIVILTAFINWGVITDWGNIRIERQTMTGSNGIEISGLIYIPKNATNDTPAPLLICYHGNAGNARNHESWAVEFARRGFVVISPDLYGSGDSDNDTDQLISYDSMIIPAEICYSYAISLPYVDSENVLVSGHSMGTDVAMGIGGMHNTKAIMCGSSGQPLALLGSTKDPRVDEYINAFRAYQGNYIDALGACESTPEKFAAAMTPFLQSRPGFENETFEDGKLYGSFEEGNAFYAVSEPNRVHEAAFVSTATVGHLIWFGQESIGNAVPNPIDANNQIWPVKDYIGLFGILAFGLFICSIALLLIEEVPFFEGVKRSTPRNIGLRKQGLLISILLALIFPFIVLKTNAFGMIAAMRVSNAASIPVAGFPIKYSNVAFCVLIGLNILGVLGFLLYFFTEGRKQKLTISDLGLTPDGSKKLSGVMIGKTILLSAVVIAIAWGFIHLQENLTGTDFYAWFFGFKSVPANKVQYFWPYMLIWIACFIVASFTINVERRLPSTGKEWLDTVIAMVFNVVLATIVLVIVIRVNWILDGNGTLKANPFWVFKTDIARLWGMPAGMAVGIGGSTLLYRKTGNTWLSAFLMGSVACIMCLTFGQLRSGM